jgi:hypothetical protein
LPNSARATNSSAEDPLRGKSRSATLPPDEYFLFMFRVPPSDPNCR